MNGLVTTSNIKHLKTVKFYLIKSNYNYLQGACIAIVSYHWFQSCPKHYENTLYDNVLYTIKKLSLVHYKFIA